jgi:hypothetical protein
MNRTRLRRYAVLAFVAMSLGLGLLTAGAGMARADEAIWTAGQVQPDEAIWTNGGDSSPGVMATADEAIWT